MYKHEQQHKSIKRNQIYTNLLSRAHKTYRAYIGFALATHNNNNKKKDEQIKRKIGRESQSESKSGKNENNDKIISDINHINSND